MTTFLPSSKHTMTGMKANLLLSNSLIFATVYSFSKELKNCLVIMSSSLSLALTNGIYTV